MTRKRKKDNEPQLCDRYSSHWLLLLFNKVENNSGLLLREFTLTHIIVFGTPTGSLPQIQACVLYCFVVVGLSTSLLLISTPFPPPPSLPYHHSLPLPNPSSSLLSFHHSSSSANRHRQFIGTPTRLLLFVLLHYIMRTFLLLPPLSPLHVLLSCSLPPSTNPSGVQSTSVCMCPISCLIAPICAPLVLSLPVQSGG